MNMAEEKFFTPEMELDALLNGRHWDDLFEKQKVKIFDPIYGPTPFQTTISHIATFTRQTCAKCKGTQTFFQGIYSYTMHNGVESYKIAPETQPYQRKQVIDVTVPVCYTCA